MGGLKTCDLPMSEQNFEMQCSLKTNIPLSLSSQVIHALEDEEIKVEHLFQI